MYDFLPNPALVVLGNPEEKTKKKRAKPQKLDLPKGTHIWIYCI